MCDVTKTSECSAVGLCVKGKRRGPTGMQGEHYYEVMRMMGCLCRGEAR